MKRKTIMIATYDQKGHPQYPEDTWKSSDVVKNHEDLLSSMKHWHKQSASTFADYPFGGFFTPSMVKFQNQNLIIDDSGEVFFGNKRDADPPEYFESAKTEYYAWYKEIKERLPKLRAAAERRMKEESERKLLKELTIKYNNQK